ncbi:MAG TPA: SUMF1/EgtB/PvdO family nonheme iron enzyme [Stellaceae bacterium]|nr:SUMF1/EgtB/PvdO family nonheme iron enzyme [Stellaceae bacterium]
MRPTSIPIIAATAFIALAAMAPRIDEKASEAPDMVVLAPQVFLYPMAGDFTRGGKPAAVPLREMRPPRPLAIMRREVTAAEYRRCIEDGGCLDVPGLADAGEHPAVTVSWRDATAYAAWLSRRLGATYRLPTDEEWAFAAGSRFTPLAAQASGNDPGAIALAAYEREAALAVAADGATNANENGLFDLTGALAEWTDTCYRHVELDAGAAPVVNCGIRVVEGSHRTYMPDFIRDPRAGGCSIGAPPRV